MAETFYTALGVPEDADDAAVRAAYREAVKEHHPDVSDDPGAEQRFKHLTTARDVLLDPDERARYDRLGHEVYVEAHLETPTRSGAQDADGADADGPDGTADATRRRGPAADATGDAQADRGGGTPGGCDGNRGTRTAERAAWLGGETARGASGGTTAEPTAGSRRHRAKADRRRHVRADPDGTAGDAGAADHAVDEPWQTASATYRRSERASEAAAERSEDLTLAEFLRDLGPWLVIHVVFIASAVATAVFTLTEANAYVQLSLPAFIVGLVLLGLVIGLSVLHLVSQVVA